MRPVNKTNAPLNEDNQILFFDKYQNYKRYLINTIGEYWSYCERHIPTSLAVELIRPKKHNPTLELVWSNLLLACTNCNSTKADTDVILTDYFWVDLDNTYQKFSYDISGLVKPNQQLNEVEQIKSKNTIKLFGLDKTQPNLESKEWEKASDKRFEHRLQAFIDANEYAVIYNNATLQERATYIKFLIDISKKGFWSIWMKAFENFPEVQKELINSFVGTNKAYFHPILNHFP
jgi:uncharacterized protein (TIGR02646 family)